MLSFCCGATGREGVGDSDKGIKAFMVTHAQSLNKTDVSPSRVKGVRMVEVGGGWHSFGDVKVDPSPRGVPPELAPPRSPRPSRPWDDRQRGSPRRGGRKDENKRDRGGSWGGGSREDDDSSSGGNASSGGDDNADEDEDHAQRKVTFDDNDDDDDDADGTHTLVLGEGDFSVLGGKDDDVKDEDGGDEECPRAGPTSRSGPGCAGGGGVGSGAGGVGNVVEAEEDDEETAERNRLRVIRMRQRATSEFQRVAAIPVGEEKHQRAQSSGV